MSKSFIKRLWWLYVACVAISWAIMATRYAQGGLITSPSDRAVVPVVLLFIMTAAGTALLFMIVAIGRYVYVDSRARGMEPLLWTSIAMLVPFFIGLAAYHEARRLHHRVCPSCKKESGANSLFCESCGYCWGKECPSCHEVAGSAARFCPQCGTGISDTRPRTE